MKQSKTAPAILIFSVLATTLLTQCTRFRVENLDPSLLASIPLGETVNTIESTVKNGVPENLPVKISSASGVLYVPDYKRVAVKVFNTDGELLGVFQPSKKKETLPEGVQQIPLNVSGIGYVSAGSDDDVYIQVRLSKEDLKTEDIEKDLYLKRSGEFSPDSYDSVPSLIYHLDNEGKVLEKIATNGDSGDLFGTVQGIYASDTSHLFVEHTLDGKLACSHYLDGILESRAQTKDFEEAANANVENLRVENDRIIPDPEGSFYLASFSYYEKDSERFKFRRVFRMEFPSRYVEMITEIQDPSETLFWVVSGKKFYIWETEVGENSVRLQVHDYEGNHINNIRLNFPPPLGLWRETYMDLRDDIYSIKIDSGKLELHTWK